jgi:hypothetical protein
MLCPCGQPSRPRVSPNGPAPQFCAACVAARESAAKRRWKKRNPGYSTQQSRDWREQNRERARETERARNAAKRTALHAPLDGWLMPLVQGWRLPSPYGGCVERRRVLLVRELAP